MAYTVHTFATACQVACPPVRDPTDFSAVGDFYQASNGSVALPVAGYNYNSDSTPLLAGLAPAGTAASFAAPTLTLPYLFSFLAKAYVELGQFDKAWGCIDEAISMIETTKETLYDAEINRVAGEIALRSPVPDAVKAEAYFERALTVARVQQAKSWELRAAMNMARLWRDQGKRDEAREILAPVYGWFTEGFDTLDLKRAKALLDELT